jgi:hypothetical protein
VRAGQKNAAASADACRPHLLYLPLLAIITHSNATRYNTRASGSRPRVLPQRVAGEQLA